MTKVAVVQRRVALAVAEAVARQPERQKIPIDD